MDRPETSITDRWQKILSGDTHEYAAFVDQYKNLVTSIAYSCTGDLTGSEDIAQETFLIAWQSRHEVREPEKLVSWLSSIARNLARQWVRKRSARSWSSTQDDMGDVMQVEPHPSEKLVSEEEQELVWRSLEAIPESYREVMVLYYRESHSIAEVASVLEITEDTARQRLSRGRGLLRAEVERTIEHTLTNSRPTARFTSGVIALITMGVGSSVANATSTAVVSAAASTAATSVLSKSLIQGAAVTTTATVTTGAMIGAAGAVTGILGGLGGTWLGTRVPQLLAPTMTERRLLEREGRLVWRLTCIYMSVLLFTVVLGLLFGQHAVARTISLVGYAVATLTFVSFGIVRGIRVNLQIKEIRKTIRPEDDPNPSWLKDKLGTSGKANKPKIEGRRFTSRLRLLGWPLYDFQVSDPVFGQVKTGPALHAKGWIAVGDKATGLLAIGNFARGIVAIGGVCFGLVSFGALSIGLLTFGGFSMGLLAIGGLAIGHSSIGGAALGWQSNGGVAVGIYSANGGLAIGGTLAEGGKAISWKYAVGGNAKAPEANTEAARVACRDSWVAPYVGTELLLKDQKKFIINQLVYSLAMPAFASLVAGGFWLSMYRRVKAVE
jgi:RNA polymerase sigma factor (sigma-70 family)